MAEEQNALRAMMRDGRTGNALAARLNAPEMRAYEPTWRDRLAMWMLGDGQPSPERRAAVSGLVGSVGMGSTGAGLVDFTPAGIPFAANEYQNAKTVGEAASSAAGLLGPAGKTLATAFAFPMYHGTGAKGLTHLNESVRGALGPGVYASPVEQVAARYGEQVYQLPAKQRNIHNGLGNRYGEFPDWKADQQRLLDAVEPERRAELQGIIDKMWSNDGYQQFARVAQMYRSEDAARALYRRAGFEGLSGHADGPEIVLFGTQPLR